MRMTPEIARLQRNPAPVLNGCAAAGLAVRHWRESQAPVLDELSRFSSGASLTDCPALEALFREGSAARALAEGAIAPMLSVMRAHLFAQPPQRHFSNGVLHSVTLATTGEASLSLALIDAAAWRTARDPSLPAAASFQPGELHTRVLAGRARARRVRIVTAGQRHAELAFVPLPLATGAAYRLNGAREALVLDAIDASMLSLRLHRQAPGAASARQYDLATGALVHQAAADQRDSRSEMIMALLRRMERSDAAPVIAGLSREGAPPARWQALRECLALDSATGVAELARVAGSAADPLREPARRLLDTLAMRDPAFARAKEELLCPA